MDGNAMIDNAGGGAFTVKTFCKAHSISVTLYYQMKKDGTGPREMAAGHRVLISFEAAKEWRRKREELCAAKQEAEQSTAS
jgi:hypothetical protein